MAPTPRVKPVLRIRTPRIMKIPFMRCLSQVFPQYGQMDRGMAKTHAYKESVASVRPCA